MKILFFIDSLGPGGKERRLLELIKSLCHESKYKLYLVLTKENVHYEEVFNLNIPMSIITRKGLKKDPRIFYKFYKIAKEFKPDIIHVWSNLVAIYALPSKVLLNTPLINNQITNSTIQNSKSLLSHKLTFPFSNKIIANTYAGLDAYNAPEKKSCVIYNGFDFNRINSLEKSEDVRNRFKIKTKFVIGMIASFTEKKDYNTFIESSRMILEKERDITFLCVGAGDSAKFESMVEAKNKQNVLFLGRQKNVESIMNICDIGVLLTNNDKHGEGISNAILEFQALGKPVIATIGGGNGEIIEDGQSGFLIKPKEPIELMEKIFFLLDKENERVVFGKNAVKIVVEKFNITRMIDEFKNVYNELIKF